MAFYSLKPLIAVRDFWLDRRQTVMALVALMITIATVGSTFRIQGALLFSLDQAHVEANPPSYVLETSEFTSEGLIDELTSLPAIEGAEAWILPQITRMKFADEVWRPLVLTGRQTLDDLNYSKLKIDGEFNIPKLKEGEIFLERSAAGLTQARKGEPIQIDTISAQHTIQIADFVYDPIALPSRFSRLVYGYATPETIAALTGNDGFNRIYLSIAPDSEMSKVETQIKKILDQHDVEYSLVKFNQENPLLPYIEPVVFLFQALGVLSIIISLFLVNTTISALIAQKMAEIGRLKAIGFPNSSIIQIYLLKAFILGAVATLFALIIEALIFNFLLNAVSKDLNVDIVPYYFSAKIFALKILVGFGLPLLASAVPVIRAVSRPADESLGFNGSTLAVFKPGHFEKRLHLLTLLPPYLLYPLRNMLRHKQRTLLMVLPLAAAGAIFISILNVRQSLTSDFKRATDYWKEDVRLKFSEPLGEALVRNELNSISGITLVEPRFVQQGVRLRPNDFVLDRAENQVNLAVVSLPYDSPFIIPSMTNGRWLNQSDTRQIVINTDYLRTEPDLTVGDSLTLDFSDDVQIQFEIIGIATGQVVGVGTADLFEPVAYLNGSFFAEQFGALRKANYFHIGTDFSDSKLQAQLATALEDHLKTFKVSPDRLDIVSEFRLLIVNTFQVTIQLTVVMSILFGIVGAIGMSSLIRLSILERTREIGVLKAIGMNNRRINQIILIEALLIGMISWLIAIPCAWLLTNTLSSGLGRIFINSPGVRSHLLVNYLSWLLVTIVISLIISISSSSSMHKKEPSLLLAAR